MPHERGKGRIEGKGGGNDIKQPIITVITIIICFVFRLLDLINR